ncbi:serine hydrolase [Flavobacteriaceae bacterium F89]|uniref:Serine hydrolase n=1 Tax=Cerina litoralis TaxID=2874477 RepID=A0AAE3EYU9_9FLAO|nr:serine hydrolase [Cerina litoralis]MCG2462111.1 serine hydrolase [Cerina litoralis]
MRRISLVLATFYLLLLHAGTYAQITSPEVDELAQKALEKFKVAGAAIAIVKDGKIVHSKGYGVKSSTSREKVNEHTQFAIASNTKAFTTMALALLVEDGIITWQDRVVEHIPEFTMYNPYVTENFNIQDLLTHRSGLGLGMGDLMFFPDGADFTIDDLLASFQYFKPVSAFRTKFDYDNLLYVVAGELIARKSGMTWEEFIQKRILEPLHMDNSYPSIYDIEDKSNLALPHTTAYGKLQVLPNFKKIINGAAGGIYANVDDLCQWMLVFLNHGAYGPQLRDTLFAEASQKEIWKIQTTLETDQNPRYNSHFSGYGLGWFLTDVKGYMQVSHTGGLPGMLSKTTLIPDLNLGVVVLTNTEPGGSAFFSTITQTILDSYLGLEDTNWMEIDYRKLKQRNETGDAVTAKVWETVASNKNSAVNKNDYLGVYKDPWFGKMEVFFNNGELWIKSYRSPKLNGPMRFYKANTFAVKWEYQDMNADAFAIFYLNENGIPQELRLKGISPNIDFSFDFQDLRLRRVKKE